MKITFILPGLPTRATGGSKVVFEYANRLSMLGDEIVICFMVDMHAGKLASLPAPVIFKTLLVRGIVQVNPKWFSLSKSVQKRCIFAIDESQVPDADCVVATGVCTARDTATLPPSKGTKAYLIQDFENWDRSDDEVKKTYRLGMRNIVVSKWLRDVVNAESLLPCTYIPNAVDTERFWPDGTIERNPFQIALLYHESAHKGWRYAWEAILRAKEMLPGISVHMFGVYPAPSNLPPWVTYTKNADESELRRIYSSSSIYVCASVKEGFGLTCVEAMACGCALVVSDFQGSQEYAVNEVNALVSPVKDIEDMAVNIARVLQDEGLRQSLALAGVRTAVARDWDGAVASFRNAIT